jgi:hypothetical protein
MCAKENGANFSSTLLVEECDDQYKYGGRLHPSKLYDGGENRKTICVHALPRWAQGTCVNGPPKSGPSPSGSAAWALDVDIPYPYIQPHLWDNKDNMVA